MIAMIALVIVAVVLAPLFLVWVTNLICSHDRAATITELTGYKSDSEWWEEKVK